MKVTDEMAAAAERELWMGGMRDVPDSVVRVAIEAALTAAPQPQDNSVYIRITRPEDYDDVHPDLVAEDFLDSRGRGEWDWEVVAAPAAQPTVIISGVRPTATGEDVNGAWKVAQPSAEPSLVQAARDALAALETCRDVRDVNGESVADFDAAMVRDAIDALRRALDAGDGMGGWIACADRMPTPGVTVLAYYRNEFGNGRRIRAQWVPAKTREGDGELDDLDLVYDEDADTCYWPEGWYECIDNWGDYSSVVVTEGEVTHWHPMPAIDAAMGDAPEAKGGGRG